MPEHEAMRDALPVLERLAAAGHSAFFVGGCVRDMLLGRPVADVDIASSARPEEVIALFERTIPTGIKHGTVTVVLDRRQYEVTTFRTESEYENHRRPAEVAFIRDLRGDLKRRDFTINAMALDASGGLHDPFGGEHDLRVGIVRCVGDAETRFREDALRMLRAVRFASAFRFAVAKSTWRALVRWRGLLAYVAMERVGAELDKMLGGVEPDRALALLWRSGLLRHTKRPLPLVPAARCSLPPVGGLSGADLRWTAVLLGLGAGPEQARAVLTRLAFGSRRAAAAAAVAALHEAVAADAAGVDAGRPAAGCGGEPQDSAGHTARTRWTEAVLAYGREAAEAWLSIMRELALLPESGGGQRPETANRFEQVKTGYAAQAAQWLDAMPVTTLNELAVGGADLLEASGEKPGEWVKGALGLLLRLCALGAVPNEKGMLLEAYRRQREKEQS